MGDATLGIIVAIIGFIGVIVGALISWFSEHWREKQNRKRDARYLGIRAVCTLDKFMDSCIDVVSDNGRIDQDGYTYSQVPLPPPPAYPDDIDWRSIDPELMYRLLSLPTDAETANRVIGAAAEHSDPPDHDDYFNERRSQYTNLGLVALELSKEIRQTFNIPLQTFRGWDPAAFLLEEKFKQEKEQLLREERHRKMLAELSQSIPSQTS